MQQSYFLMDVINKPDSEYGSAILEIKKPIALQQYCLYDGFAGFLLLLLLWNPAFKPMALRQAPSVFFCLSARCPAACPIRGRPHGLLRIRPHSGSMRYAAALRALTHIRAAGAVLFFLYLGQQLGGNMGATQAQAKQQADLSFVVVQNGANYAPVLVQRRSFNSKVGSSSARKIYQTAYAPKDFPAATRVVSAEPF